MDINDITYGHPIKKALKDLEKIRELGVTAQLFLLLVEAIKPPLNDSAETLEELEYLYELQEEERPYMERIIKRADDSVSGVFFDMCGEWQIDTYEEEALALMKKWGSLAGVMKLYFNRARPYQLAPHHGIPLFPMPSISAWSGAFPSGHTIQAEALSRFYGEKYPEIAEEFDKVAKSISHTRLVGGFHFPSDVLASEMLIEILWEHL